MTEELKLNNSQMVAATMAVAHSVRTGHITVEDAITQLQRIGVEPWAAKLALNMVNNPEEP